MTFEEIKELYRTPDCENSPDYPLAVDTLASIEIKAARDAGYMIFDFDKASNQIVLRRDDDRFQLVYSLNDWENVEREHLEKSNSKQEFRSQMRMYIENDMDFKFKDEEPDIGLAMTELPDRVPDWAKKYYRCATEYELVELCEDTGARDISHTYDLDALRAYGYTFVAYLNVREDTPLTNQLLEDPDYGYPMLVMNKNRGYEIINMSNGRCYGLADPEEDFGE